MCTDDKCVRAFVELRAFPCRSINDYGNVQFNPLAPPVFQPSFCVIEFLVGHTNHDKAAILQCGHNGCGGFQTSIPSDKFIKCGQGNVSAL